MRRAIVAATIGNGLEFYDFVTFAFFAIQIGHTFFPSGSAYLSLMGALATFGAGFVGRPIGAFVLGGYADRAGRKPAMLLSMVLMGAGILLLGLTPGYATIGLAGPVIAIAARLIQGFALGGEVGSATVYMLEAAPDERRGLAISWQSASQEVAGTIGALVGLGLTLALTPAQLDGIGWRIALLLGATIVPFALLVRRALPETHAPPDPASRKRTPIMPHRRIIAMGAVTIAAGTIGTYVFKYMATFGQATLKLAPAVSFAGQTANAAVAVIAALAGGALSDRHGRRPIMIAPQIAFVLAIVPCFAWMIHGHDLVSFVGANLVLSALSGIGYGAVYAAISESLPSAVRARLFALVYALPICLFGGTTQLVVTWLLRVTGDPMALAWYLAGVSLVGLLAMLMIRESAPARAGTNSMGASPVVSLANGPSPG